SRLPQGLVDRLSPATVAALLGEILLDVESHPGGADPCEPQEPYEELRLSYVTVNRSYDDATGKVSGVSERGESSDRFLQHREAHRRALPYAPLCRVERKRPHAYGSVFASTRSAFSPIAPRICSSFPPSASSPST